MSQHEFQTRRAAARKRLAKWAAIDFKPLSPEDLNATRPPSAKAWDALKNPHLVAMRLAWAMLFLSKAETVDAVRALGEEDSGELISALEGAIAFCDVYAGMLREAEERMLCAGAVLEQEAAA
jgi:hypothetical protein